MSDEQSIRFYVDLEIAADIGVAATPRLAGLSRCVFSAPAAARFVHAFGSLATGRERTNGDTVMRVWTNDYETTYPTAQLHPRYLAASTAEARYAVVFEYTVFLVSNFLRRVDGAFFGQFRGCGRACDRAPAPLASFRRQTPLCGTCATGKEPEARAQPGRLLGSGR
jgi:hypothetical protein